MKISIQGIPASGKTYLIRALQSFVQSQDPSSKFKNFEFHLEPVFLWEPWFKEVQEGTCSFFLFQKRIQQSLVNRSHQIPNQPHVIHLLERSIESADKVFIPALKAWGKLKDNECTLLREEHPPSTEKMWIFVSTPLHICLERLNMRGQAGDPLLTPKYMELLYENQFLWYKQSKCPVLEVVGNLKIDPATILNQVINIATPQNTN